MSDKWYQLPGAARDIAIGAVGDGHVGWIWVIGTNQVPGGYGIFRWVGSDWDPIDGGAVRIAVDPGGNPWVVNAADEIFQRAEGSWRRLPGSAKDIGIGADGSAWVIGTNEVPGGYGIFQWSSGSDDLPADDELEEPGGSPRSKPHRPPVGGHQPMTWNPIDGGAVRIAVDPGGNPWVVNAADEIFQRTEASWRVLPGRAKDIAISKRGTVTVIGTNQVPGGYGVYRWTGRDWSDATGKGAAVVALDEEDNPWLVDDEHRIFILSGSNF